MRKPVSVAAVAAVAAALVIGLSPTASMAATSTWSVTRGGVITGTAATILVQDWTTRSPIFTCTSSALNGSLKSGHGLMGAGIGTVTSFTSRGCSGDGHAVSVSTGRVKWPLRVRAYDSESGVTRGWISNIHFAVSSSF